MNSKIGQRIRGLSIAVEIVGIFAALIPGIIFIVKNWHEFDGDGAVAVLLGILIIAVCVFGAILFGNLVYAFGHLITRIDEMADNRRDTVFLNDLKNQQPGDASMYPTMGPIAEPPVQMVPKTDNVKETSALSQVKLTMICPKCHAKIPENSKFCYYCGGHLETSDPSEKRA